jgi:hypothetical protein
MKLINNLRKQLATIGASLDDTSNEHALNCDAPSGYVWRANGCTCITIHFATNRQSWLAQAIREDGLPQLKMGLVKVTDPEEIEAMRHDLDDDSWGAPMEAPARIEWTK